MSMGKPSYERRLLRRKAARDRLAEEAKKAEEARCLELAQSHSPEIVEATRSIGLDSGEVRP